MATLENVKSAVSSNDLEAYNEALDAYADRCPDAAKKWEDIGLLRYAMSCKHGEWIVTNLVPPDGDLGSMAVLHKRRAMMEIIMATEGFAGMFFERAIEAGVYLRATGVGSPADAPPDLADRVALLVEEVGKKDDEDLFYLLTHGAHWLVAGCRTQAEMEELVSKNKHKVSWIPHVRKRARQTEGDPSPAKKTKTHL
jgi:hypothetical protein